MIRLGRPRPPRPTPVRPEPHREVGRRLLALRVSAQLSQHEVADDAGLSLDLLASVEKGSTDPTLPELVRLAAVLAHYADVDPDATLVDLVVAAGLLPASVRDAT